VTGEGVERLVQYLAAQLEGVHSSGFTVQSPELQGSSAKNYEL
jgi:hypothetical protein